MSGHWWSCRFLLLIKLFFYFLDIELDNVCPSTFAVGTFLASEHPDIKKAFVIGSRGLKSEVASIAGVEVVEAVPEITSEQDFVDLR